jgi:uncharacterized membrane protein YphA (DoxX/SURF4 family)
MKYAIAAIRVVFGVWFVMSGYRYWQPNMPMGRTPVAMELMTALVHSDLMLIVKAIELIVGAMLLANVWVPLALVIGFPVTLVVAYVCLVIEWPATRPLIGGGATLVLHVVLLFAYLDYYRTMLKLQAPLMRPAQASANNVDCQR